jgi:hypothetical protein
VRLNERGIGKPTVLLQLEVCSKGAKVDAGGSAYLFRGWLLPEFRPRMQPKQLSQVGKLLRDSDYDDAGRLHDR